MNVCEMYEVLPDMECQRESKDTKLRVHMPVVRDEDGKAFHVAVWSNRQKRIARWAIIAACLAVEVVLTVWACVRAGAWASDIAYRQRGYMSIGSEVIFGPAVGFIVLFVSEKVIGGVSAMINELNDMH